MGRLGCYWSVWHRRQEDYAYFKALQPSVFKVMDGGPPDYAFARDNLPGALIIARDWALSEQHSDMLRDPIGTGERHAREWSEKQPQLGFDRAKTLILGINEPQVWNPGVPEALRQYTIAMCGEAKKFGLRVGAMQLSVGWPANKGEGQPPDWSPFHGVEQAINSNGGALILHEYWADHGPDENWGWWAGRALKCPWQVPIVIGECGVDMFVKDTSVGQQKRGWRGNMPAERYAAELGEYTTSMNADPRFVGCCVFASDYANQEWYSFDVQPAYNEILKLTIPDRPTPPDPAPSPEPPADIETGTVTAKAGLNVRTGPGTEHEKIGALAYGSTVLSDGAVFGWLHLADGWVSAEYVGEPRPEGSRVETQELPAVSIPPATERENWQRSLDFILRWEGLWADDPKDAGGATMKGITIATYTRWRKAHGEPQPTKADLRNISDAEVEEIYYQWYWLPAHCDKMAWPLCLANFNLAVNAGVGQAEETFLESGNDFLRYMSRSITWYTTISGWPNFGQAWTRRNADVLRTATS